MYMEYGIKKTHYKNDLKNKIKMDIMYAEKFLGEYVLTCPG